MDSWLSEFIAGTWSVFTRRTSTIAANIRMATTMSRWPRRCHDGHDDVTMATTMSRWPRRCHDGHDDVTESCAKQTNFRLPSPNEEAIVDVTVDQAMVGTCWAKCVFDHYNLMENNTLDMDKVRSYYKRYHQTDPEYATEMLNAYEKCHTQSEEATEKFLSLPIVRAFSTAKFCKPTSSIIMSCVIYNFFHNCPASRWSNTTECVETLAFARKCKDVLTTM
uniref:IP01869p n=1 Tax=Drosophila melanogaster TaxID=7227 RepID=Q4V3G7_DROME|nr:IP01869p [Drosophila melanogaster]